MNLIATTMFVVLITGMYVAGMSLALQDADGHIHERELHISECRVDRKGNRTVTVWARKAVFLPLMPVRVIRTKIQDTVAYEQVRTYGPGKFLGRYVKKRRGVTVTDEYLELKPLYGPFRERSETK